MLTALIPGIFKAFVPVGNVLRGGYKGRRRAHIIPVVNAARATDKENE